MTKCVIKSIDFGKREMTFAVGGKTATVKVVNVFFKDFEENMAVEASFVRFNGRVICDGLSYDLSSAESCELFGNPVAKVEVLDL
jgi:hypothetical protein